MQLFYFPEASSISQQIQFDKEESRHIVKVLRKNPGDLLEITNGKGSFFSVEVTVANPNKCSAKILTENKQKPLPYQLHLAVAPTKLNDRFEWFLEKATEIGVSEITPIICDRSERKNIKPERYEKILQSAMKQSLKAYLPKLNPVVSFKEFISATTHSVKHNYIAHCENTNRKSLKDCLTPTEDILIIIGPEGDFTPSEISFAIKNNFVPVTLGKSRLRTETAAVVACHSVAFINE